MSTRAFTARRTTQLKNRLDELLSLLEQRHRHLDGDLVEINDNDVLALAGLLVIKREEEALESLLQDQIARVRAALEKAEQGADSRCENCGSIIPEERLKVCPEATRCVRCQRKHERKRG